MNTGVNLEAIWEKSVSEDGWEAPQLLEPQKKEKTQRCRSVSLASAHSQRNALMPSSAKARENNQKKRKKIFDR